MASDATTTFAGHKLDRSVVPLLLTLGLGVFLGALDLSVLSPALPAIGKEFGVATGDLVVGVHAVSAREHRRHRGDEHARGPLRPAPGVSRLRRNFSRRHRTGRRFSQDYGLFLIARAVQAFGAGGIFPVATAAIGDVVPRQRRGAALGLVAATWGLAAVVGPLYGGLVTHFVSWRCIFAPNFPIAAFVLIFALRYVPTNAPRARGPLDVPGLFLLCVGLLFLMYGINGVHAVTIAFGLLLLAAFCHVAARVPLSDRAAGAFCKRADRQNVRTRNRHRRARGLALLHSGRAGRRAAYLVRRSRRDCGGRRVHVRRSDSGFWPRAGSHRQPGRAARGSAAHRERAWFFSRSASRRFGFPCSR